MSIRIAKSWRAALGGLAALAACFSAVAQNAETNASEKAAEKAVWGVQEIYFHYVGFTTQYSCDALRDRVRTVIAQLGAHESSVVNIAGCVELSGPAKNPAVRIVMAHPVPATEANLQSIAQDTKRAELIAAMQRKSKTPLAITTDAFDAERAPVVLSSKAMSPTSSAGDCELLEQLRDRVIKPMGGNVVKDELRCMPYQGTAGNSRLTVDMLVAKRS
jgi:hypothetical protein